jgi:hypothetical protein
VYDDVRGGARDEAVTLERAQRLRGGPLADPHRIANLEGFVVSASTTRGGEREGHGRGREEQGLIAERDLVAVHSHYKTWNMAGVDIFRFDETGKIIEHWDVLQQVPETTASGDDMFSQLS